MLPNTQNGQTYLFLLNTLIIPVLKIYASDMLILTKAQTNFCVRQKKSIQTIRIIIWCFKH